MGFQQVLRGCLRPPAHGHNPSLRPTTTFTWPTPRCYQNICKKSTPALIQISTISFTGTHYTALADSTNNSPSKGSASKQLMSVLWLLTHLFPKHSLFLHLICSKCDKLASIFNHPSPHGWLKSNILKINIFFTRSLQADKQRKASTCCTQTAIGVTFPLFPFTALSSLTSLTLYSPGDAFIEFGSWQFMLI